jgi:aryl-alcohol dehydrogenase-like predicted oxidoreductase
MYTERYWKDREFDTVAALAAVARERGVELATLAVAWALAHPAITAPIIGASSPEQLRATLAAVDYTVDAALKAKLDQLSAEYRMGDAPR